MLGVSEVQSVMNFLAPLSSCATSEQLVQAAQWIALKSFKSGRWLYGDEVPHEVWIVKQNFDYYYDEDYEDGPEELNSEGELYQLVFARAGQVLSIGASFKSLEDATAAAATKCPSLSWDNHLLQKLFHGRLYKLEP
jgi:hypothetical protein